MAKEFRLPDLGEGVHEGQIIKLLVDEGEEIREDQPLMEVETDKAAVEIPSPVAGRIARWHVKERQIVNVGDVMVTFDIGNRDSGAARAKEVAATGVSRSAAAASVATASRSSAVTLTRGSHATTAGRRKPASPAVRKLARQLGIDLNDVTGSGPGGRVSRADVEAAAKGAAGVSSSAPSPRRSRQDSVAPSAAGNASISTAAQGGQPIVNRRRELPEGIDESDQFGPVRRVAISQTRKTIAGVMTRSWTTIPHVTDSDDADVTDLERLRKQYNAEGGEVDRPKLTMLAFVVRAVARALRLYPVFNASFDAEKHEISYRKYVNIAVGVHTERGLIAPVIRDADQLSISQIAASLGELADKAHEARFAIDDTRGATYTISNAGALGGSRYSTPMITPPQVAVLALGRMREMPWVVGGTLVPRLIMPLSHSFDHRIIDGGEEVAFMRQVIGDLEQPGRLMM